MTIIKLSIILLIGASLCCHPQKQIENISNEKINARVGESFSISLPTHPGTGFTWEIKTIDDTTMVRFIKKEYIEIGDESYDIPGNDYFEFKALQKGQSKITLWYIRPWKKVHDYQGIKNEKYRILIK